MKCIDGTEAFQARFESCVGKPSGGSYTPKKLWDFDQDTCQCERNRPVPDFKLAVKVSIVFTPNFESSKISDMVALGREVCAVLRRWENKTKGEDCRKMVYVDPGSVRYPAVEGGPFEAVLIFKSKFVGGLDTDADATSEMLFKYFIDQVRVVIFTYPSPPTLPSTHTHTNHHRHHPPPQIYHSEGLRVVFGMCLIATRNAGTCVDPLQISDVDLVLMDVCGKGEDKQLVPIGVCEDGSVLSAAGRNAASPAPFPLMLLVPLLLADSRV